MKTKLFNKINTIVNVLILASLISAYTIGINPLITLPIITLSLIFKREEDTLSRKALLINIILLILTIFLIFPALTYPTIRTDFYNHASTSKNLANEKNFETFLHKYPRGTQSLLASLIQISPFNFFQTTTIFSVLVFILTSFDVYLLSKKWLKNEEKSWISVILFSFSMPVLWNLQLGFIPSLLGFYLLINSLKNENSKLSYLNSASLAVVYPHYLAVLFLYFLLQFIFKKDLKKMIKKITVPLLISGFEFFPLVYQQFFKQTETVLLMKGGIFVPNLTFLAIYGILMIIALRNLKLEKLKEKEFVLLLSPLILQVLISTSVVLNYLFKLTKYVTLKQFYMVVKLSYFDIIPLSMIISSRVKNKKVIKILPFIFIFLFTGSIMYIKSNTYPNTEIFEIEHRINSLITPNSTILIDEKILNEVRINTPPFYYKSLINLPNNNSEIIRINVEKTLRTNWMNFTNGTFYYNNTKVFHYSGETDYYIGYNNSKRGNYLYNGSELYLVELK